MTWSSQIWVALLASFLVTLILTPLARRLGLGVSLIDVPNERSSHTVPTPRTGGIAIILGVIAGVTATASFNLNPTAVLLVCAVTLGVVALYDDRRTLPHHFRLFAQIFLATLALLATQLAPTQIDPPALGTLTIGFMGIPLAVFWIVGVTNAYNFMDGINGLASLEAIVSSITLAVLMLDGGDTTGTLLAISIGGAAAGFLPWNLGGWIFMGDVGSAGLGFLLSLLVLRASLVAPGVAAALPLFPFLFDAGLTLVRRAARGERWFSTPHRSHFYQRLVGSGLSHVSVSLIYTVLALISSALALAYGQLSDAERILGLVLLVLVHATVVPGTTFLESRRKIAPV